MYIKRAEYYSNRTLELDKIRRAATATVTVEMLKFFQSQSKGVCMNDLIEHLKFSPSLIRPVFQSLWIIGAIDVLAVYGKTVVYKISEFGTVYLEIFFKKLEE